MASWWETLIDRILSFLERDPEEVQRRRSLRRILETLKKGSPPLYRPSSGQVLPGLADHLLVLARTLQPIGRLLSRTIGCSEDGRFAERFLDELVEARLSGELRQQAEGLHYEAIQQRLTGEPEGPEVWKRLDEEMAELSRLPADPLFRQIDAALCDLQALDDLCRYDFERTLQVFDPLFSLAAPDTRNFQPVGGQQLLPHLLDLHFVMTGARVTSDLQDDLGRLLHRLERERAEETGEKLHHSLARLQRLLQVLNLTTLLNLLRAIRSDPALQPEVARGRTSYAEDWLKRIDQRYRQARDRILRENRERDVTRQVRELFEGADLPDLTGYDAPLSEALAKDGFPPLRWIGPLSILRAFTRTRFERGPSELIKRLLVEGQFEDRIFESTLSGAYYGCAGLGEQIDRFEASLSGTGQTTTGSIRRYLDQHRQGKAVTVVLNKLVDTVDQRAGRLVEDGANLFHNLAGLLIEVLDDLRQSSQNRMVNLRTIGGNANREYLMSLTRGLGDIRSLVEILSSFTVLRKIQRT